MIQWCWRNVWWYGCRCHLFMQDDRLPLALILLMVNFWYELGKLMTRYVFLDARFVIWLAIDLLLLLVKIWCWENNEEVWLLEARWLILAIFQATSILLFSVVRKLILNGGAIRHKGLLLHCRPTWLRLPNTWQCASYRLVKLYLLTRMYNEKTSGLFPV